MNGCGAPGNNRRAVARSPPCSSRTPGSEVMVVTLTIVAVLIELIAGYPDLLLRSIGHPVTWMGRLIAALERRWNHETDAPALRRMLGVLAVALASWPYRRSLFKADFSFCHSG